MLLVDKRAQPCGSTALSARETKALHAPLATAPFARHVPRPPTRHALTNLPRLQTAIATVAFAPNATPRFAHDRPVAALLCGVALQRDLLRTTGGLKQGYDYVVVHHGIHSEAVEHLRSTGVVVVEGDVPPKKAAYLEFEVATLMKVTLLRLTAYARVLYIDIDMFARRDISTLLTVEYPEPFVGFAETSAPVGANLFILRPNEAAWRAARKVVDARRFDVASGWNHSGLATWPSERGTIHCSMPYLTRLRGGRNHSCSLSSFWYRRCATFGVTNWNWVSANIDQGIFWWLYNLTEHGPARVLHRPQGPNGTRDAAGHSAWWVHMQGYCKPWLAGTPAFGKNPRCGNMLKDLLQSFWVAPRRETTLTQCSIAGLVAER